MKRWAKMGCALFLFLSLGLGCLGPKPSVSLARSKAEAAQTALAFVPGRILVQFRPEITKSRSRRLIAQAGAYDAGEIPGISVHVLELPAGADEEIFVHAFKSRPEVAFAERDGLLAPEAIAPNDFWYSSEWHLPKIAAAEAWSKTTGASSIAVAICDTGVDGTHPDLAPKMVAGWNVYNNNADTSDVHGHGTEVAGAAAACSNNSIGVASVAWGCSIMPIRVSDPSGYATYSAIAAGIRWAADHGARVANVSYEATDSSTVRSAAQYMQSKGGVTTMAAGNESLFDSSPDNPYVLTVSATNISDFLSDFSNKGNNVDLAAPEGAYTTSKGGGYTYSGGTSIAAPIVAGVAALVLSINPALTGGQVQDILKQNADDLGAAGWDTDYGWGRVNAARAVNAASGGGVPDSIPPAVSFTSPAQGGTVAGIISAQVAASDNVGVSWVSISVDGVSLGTDAAAPYTFSWDTATVGNGTHVLKTTASDTAGNIASASITVNVNNAGDTTPPTVIITSPTNGSAVSGNVSVAVRATDDRGVSLVEMYVDGVLKATSTSAPFTTKWNTRREAAGAHTVQCKAYDAAGNLGASQVITVYR